MVIMTQHDTLRALEAEFFDREAGELALALLGKRLRHHTSDGWLEAQIIETEAYYRHEKGSHASLGYTEKRKALFMPPGTLYMYYARGGDSFNISARGEGNAVLIKSAIALGDDEQIQHMQRNNPLPGGRQRPADKLCSGQTLLCRSLALKVPQWDQQRFNQELMLADSGYRPQTVIQTTRLGIPPGRDEHLPLRYIDAAYAGRCTRNPLTRRGWRDGREYRCFRPADRE